MEKPAINISKFEVEIAAEFTRLFGANGKLDEFTKQIVDVAATTAAIAIKLREEQPEG